MDDKINNEYTSLYFLYSIFIKFVFQLSIFNIFPCTFLFTTIQT